MPSVSSSPLGWSFFRFWAFGAPRVGSPSSFQEVRVPLDVGSIAANSGWAVFWIQLPATALVIAVIIVGLAAILKARPEDIPAVFASFAASFGRRPVQRTLPSQRRRPRRGASGTTQSDGVEESA